MKDEQETKVSLLASDIAKRISEEWINGDLTPEMVTGISSTARHVLARCFFDIFCYTYMNETGKIPSEELQQEISEIVRIETNAGVDKLADSVRALLQRLFHDA